MSLKKPEEYSLLNIVSGYRVIQQKGERRLGPPINCTDITKPEKGCEIYIGGLPRDLFEDELFPFLSSIGTIYQIRLKVHFSGLTRGYAFATYTKPSDAIRAVQVLNRREIRPNHPIGVQLSFDNNRLFIGNLPQYVTQKHVIEELSHKTQGLVDVVVRHRNNNSTGMSSLGFAFVTYQSHWHASMARRVLLPDLKSGKLHMFGTQVMVNWAIPTIPNIHT
ncbi:RNA-binding protein 47-like [Oppia nitens]|uniref:RNA-binding protein 47-like n=1 Tax=Oppia nitens TaxID=1686743 RepID=UPI0023DB3B45|nr:RNA-binding protein 47-like [Oppia nitens]